MDELQNDVEQSGLSRRTVVAGAAWAVPVIAIASSAPMAAASEPPVVSGAAITASNFQGSPTVRYVRVSLNDENYDAIPFPAGAVTITLTVTGTGTLSDLTNIVGGAFSPAITELTAGVYTIVAVSGAANFNFRGSMSGSLTLQAKVDFIDNLGDPSSVTSEQAVLSA